MNPLTDDGDDTEPTSFLVEFTPEQMRTFWIVTNDWEETQLGWDDCSEDRAMLRSVQEAVSAARPIWDGELS